MARRELEEVEKPCNNLLEWKGFDVVKMSQPQPAVRMTPGTPDCYARHPSGFRVWVEYKHSETSGGVTDAQEEWHRRERKCGGRVWVIHSFDELAEKLTEAGFPVETN